MADLGKVFVLSEIKKEFGWDKEVTPPEDQLRARMEAAGINPPPVLFLDGKIHRFPTDPGKPGDDAGYYIAFSDFPQSGSFGDYRRGIEDNWTVDFDRSSLSPEELQRLKRQAKEAKERREKEQAEDWARVADECREAYSAAGEPPEEHPYLKAKGISTGVARIDAAGRLLIPVLDVEGNIQSLQRIFPDGMKRTWPGGKMRGGMLAVNDAPADRIIVSEGYATASTVGRETGALSVCAFSSGNLERVVKAIREKYSTSEIIIMADNDEAGRAKAEKAAKETGARIVMPPDPGQDANDFYLCGGDIRTLIETAETYEDALQVVWSDDLEDEWEAPDEIIQGLLTSRSLSVIYGDSNAGKTFWAVSMAHAVAHGRPFHGRMVDPGVVVYVATEAPDTIKSRMQALKKYYGESIRDIAIIQKPINFHSSDGDASQIIAFCREIERRKGRPVRLVIGDTLSRMSAGANENSGEDMGPVMDRFNSVAHEIGAAVVVIHHTGKNKAAGSRGWSGIRAYIDTEIEIEDTGETKKAEVSKQRRLSSKGDAIYFKLEALEMGLGKFGNTVTECVAIDDPEGAENCQKTDKGSKQDKKYNEALKAVEKAWWASGCEIVFDKPYVTRSALQDYLISQGKPYRTAKNYCDQSNKSGVIYPLIEGESIEKNGHGWVVIDIGKSAQMMLSKNEKSNNNNKKRKEDIF